MGGTNFSDGGIRNGSTTDNYFTNDAGNTIFLRCTTANIPSAKSGYAVGCELQDATTGIWYSNTGTTSSCTFTVSSLTPTGNKGYYVVAKTAVGTTVTNVFGTTNGFASTITGIYVVAAGATAAVMTISSNGVVATVTTSSSIGGMTGASSLSNTALTAGGTFGIYSDNASDTSTVFVTFTTP